MSEFSAPALDPRPFPCGFRVSDLMIARSSGPQSVRETRTSLGRTLRPILTRVLGHYFEPKVTAEEIAIASGHGAAPGGIAALGLQEGLSAGGTVSL